MNKSHTAIAPSNPKKAARAYGRMAALGGVILVTEGFLVGKVMLIAFFFESMSDAPRGPGGADWTKAGSLLLGTLVAGVLAFMWGIRMMFGMKFSVVALSISVIFSAAVMAVALLPVFRLMNVVVGLGMLACAGWWAREGWKAPGASEAELLGAPAVAGSDPGTRPHPESRKSPREKKIAKMVESLKGGRDRKTKRDVESWD